MHPSAAALDAEQHENDAEHTAHQNARCVRRPVDSLFLFRVVDAHDGCKGTQFSECHEEKAKKLTIYFVLFLFLTPHSLLEKTSTNGEREGADLTRRMRFLKNFLLNS
jgi:hypothetical protein